MVAVFGCGCPFGDRRVMFKRERATSVMESKWGKRTVLYFSQDSIVALYSLVGGHCKADLRFGTMMFGGGLRPDKGCTCICAYEMPALE